MTTTLELQQLIIDKCHTANACQDQFKQLLLKKENPAHFVRVLLNNHDWCLGKEIYTAELLSQFDPEILTRAGLATSHNCPVDFNPVEVGGRMWAGMNHGATRENLNGLYHTFDEALVINYADKWKQPSDFEFTLLAAAPSQWGLYENNFGRVFQGDSGNLFLPASGYRSTSNGSFYTVGRTGYCWSGSVYNATNGFYLNFSTTNVYPQNTNTRSYGFPVRCVSEP